MAYGYEPGGIFGYSNAMGGSRGSHAEYIRIPFAEYGAGSGDLRRSPP